jgi:DNA-binding transcriptional MerR regulator
MGKYSIKDLEKLSGVRAHTIRIWEKRYGVINPDRTNTNIRTYCDEELKKLLNIAVLNQHGYKISKIAKFDKSELNEKVAGLGDSHVPLVVHVDRLVVAMIDMDREKFNDVVEECTASYGFEQACLGVIYPFLEKIGILWTIGQVHPAQEHFISHLIRQKMLVAIDKEQELPLNGKKFILFLKEGEYHEIGLLFYHYVLTSLGHEVVYLGQSVPYTDVVKVVEWHKADALVTAFVANISKDEMCDYMTSVSSESGDLPIIALGAMSNKCIDIDNLNIHICSSVGMFKEQVADLF